LGCRVARNGGDLNYGGQDTVANKSGIEIYQSEDGLVKIDVRLDDETVWLTQQQIAELFDTARSSVVEHIKHIYEDDELSQDATCREFRQVRSHSGQNRPADRKKLCFRRRLLLYFRYE